MSYSDKFGALDPEVSGYLQPQAEPKGLRERYEDSSTAQWLTLGGGALLMVLGAAGIAACATGFLMHGSNGLTNLSDGAKWAIGGTGLGVCIIGVFAAALPIFIFSRKMKKDTKENNVIYLSKELSDQIRSIYPK